MNAAHKRPRKTKAQLNLAKLLREFIDAPTTPKRLEDLCAGLMQYELEARYKAIVAASNASEALRAEVKASGLCRDCRVTLDESNRASASGYQCHDCKRRYMREYQAKRRATQAGIN